MLDENDSTGEAQAETETPTETPTEAGADTAPGTPADPEVPTADEAAAGTPEQGEPAGDAPAAKASAKKKAAKKSARKTTKKKAASPEPADEDTGTPTDGADSAESGVTDGPDAEVADGTPEKPAKKAAKRAARKPAKKASKKAAAAAGDAGDAGEAPEPGDTDETDAAPGRSSSATAPLFQPPEVAAAPVAGVAGDGPEGTEPAEPDEDTEDAADTEDTAAAESDQDGDEAAGTEDREGGEQGGTRRRRRRGGRRRRRSGDNGDNGDAADEAETGEQDADPTEAANDAKAGKGAGKGGKSAKAGGDGGGKDADAAAAEDDKGEGGTSRRRRRRRRSGEDGDASPDDPQNTVTRVRKGRSAEDEITSVSGSTRLEAKKQRRREGREAGRRRAPIVSEAEFLARRESVDRVMVIRQREDLTQIAVLEDKVLVEHYVARESQTSLIGNVYLGRVQNVLPSMEAAFVDIGKGRNAVLYAGEVNWDALGAGNGPRKIEQVLKSGQAILVQVTKDPIGHKGARLTSQVSLPGRFLVYVPDGTTSGISRKLPDTERARLKNLLKDIVPDTAGVIVRTAAEGASEEELTRDVERLTARWTDIEAKVEKGNAPQLLYGEPDLTLKVVRDLFTEDFAKLVVSGDDAWDMVEGYVQHVAPDLADRLERHDGEQGDVFAAYRIDEQIAKALDRKVWLPSGGSLIIDRTEAMTVVDVNTGKFTGSGGNLEETVTKNNLEAAEEIVRQLRLRDIGGIIVVDFIDMVLESNRDLVLRRLVECLGRDRTRHQVAEVTSLGLVQMTRKRIGTGLLEAFSETCEHCQGRGLVVHHEPVEQKKKPEEDPRRGRRGRRGRGEESGNGGNGAVTKPPTPKDVAAMARAHAEQAHDEVDDHEPEEQTTGSAPADPPVEQGQQTEQPTDEPTAERDEQPDATEEPADQSSGESPEDSAEGSPEAAPAPVLVTSSRRRVARRPAGPPSGALATAVSQEPDLDLDTTDDGIGSVPEAPTLDGAPAAGGPGEETDSAGSDEIPEPPRVHVPVKKRGRKR